MMKFILVTFFLCLSVSNARAWFWESDFKKAYGEKYYSLYYYNRNSEEVQTNLKKYGVEMIQNCIETYFGDPSMCDSKIALASFKKFGSALIKRCLKVYENPGMTGEHCFDDHELAQFKKDEHLIMACLKVTASRAYCTKDSSIELHSKFTLEIIQRCLHVTARGNNEYCNETSEIEVFKKHPDVVISKCYDFYQRDISKCDTLSEVDEFAKFMPYIDVCTYITDDCSQCASYTQLEKFTKLNYSEEFKALDYFKLNDIYDFVIEPACSVFQLELRPKYENYLKKIDAESREFAFCETNENKSNLVAKRMSSLVSSLLGDIKYKSLYLASRTNERMKRVFLDFVKEHVEKSNLKDKVIINEDGISYADEKVSIALSFRESIDNKGDKTNILGFKSLTCEKQYPRVEKLSYEGFKNQNLPPDCVLVSLNKDKIKKVNEGAAKIKMKVEVEKGKKAKETQL